MNKIIKEDCLTILDKVNLNKFKNSSILLTGSNGLLGRYIVSTIYLGNKLQNLNCKIYCVSLHGPNDDIKKLIDDKNVIAIKTDLSEPFSFEYDIDYIFHAACYGQPKLWLENKLKTISLNVNATKSLLSLAHKNNAKFLFFSTLDVYGDIPEESFPVEETFNGNLSTTSPRAAYGESKRLGETICSIYRDDLEVKTYIVRIFHTYGPGVSIHDERVLGNFMKKALFEKEIKMLDQGKSIKTFGYISDIIYMIISIMLDGQSTIYNVGGVDKISIKTLADLVSKYCGNVPVKPAKRKVNLKHIGTDLLDYIDLSVSKFENEFGKVQFMKLDEGIKRTIDWNISTFNIKNEL